MTSDFVVLLATHEKVISVDSWYYGQSWAKGQPIAYVLYWLHRYGYAIKEFQVTSASYGVDGTHYNYQFYILSRVRTSDVVRGPADGVVGDSIDDSASPSSSSQAPITVNVFVDD